ncbi:RagB/SusD family nutrient uptake outer membrane protein [Hymenobacter psychrophilus]|uniref:Starch-binding associating with outer membrane n=1 Tax=Hymenobacter psychrophilus TaxID=651662 RepID=A0A1H3LAG4_9BACT|nr:RagB/SusD family nutrient uptake outer membrane protein [Hymenobacter psychrophilus]SDY60918.1 Starch-binding associating with outer membrane [Hymenobacter psychrophilus]
MRKSFITSALGLSLALAGLSSCQDFLATTPDDFVAPQGFYNNESQLTAALMGVYGKLGQEITYTGSTEESTYSRFLSLEAPAATDEMLARSNTAPAVSQYGYDAAHANLVNCWSNLYEAINRANVLLENLDKANTSDVVKAQIRAEALFLRGYYHFVLVGYWGDVPLKLQSTTAANNVDIARTPAAEVYAQVIRDMTEAEGVLKNGTEWGHSGRISKTAAAGVLARVNLYAAGRLNDPSKYAAARTWALKVINSGQHGLNPNYSQIFKNHSADIYELRESMWEVEFNGNGVGSIYNEGGRFASTLGVRNDITELGFMQGTYVATGVQYALYGTGDLRRDWNIATYYYPNYDATRGATPYASTYTWGRYINKWRREGEAFKPYAKNLSPTNWPLLRYADVLLMFAEADSQVNGGPTAAGLDALNQVRRRGYGLPVGTAAPTVDVPTGQSQSAFFTRIKDERGRELAFEGWRKLDLLRWNIFLPTLKGMIPIISTQAPSSSNNALGYNGRNSSLVPYQNASERDLLWPIPANELALNKLMTQNPGW